MERPEAGSILHARESPAATGRAFKKVQLRKRLFRGGERRSIAVGCGLRVTGCLVLRATTRLPARPARAAAAGGRTTGRALRLLFHCDFSGHGLVDEYRLGINPVLLGKGTPLFQNVPERTKLELTHVRPLKSGVVILHYRPEAA